MKRKDSGLVLESEKDYREALERAEKLRAQGAKTSDNPELAELEGAIESYSTKADQPATEKGRPERS